MRPGANEVEAFMGQFISKVIRLGIFLAAIGQLKPATMFFMREVAKQHQRGLISLSALSHTLFDERKARPAAHRRR